MMTYTYIETWLSKSRNDHKRGAIMDTHTAIVCITGGLAVLVLLVDWFWDHREKTAQKHLPTKENSHGASSANML